MIEASETSKELLKLNEYTKTIAKYKESANSVPDVSTEEGYKHSKKIHKEGRKIWNAIDKARVEIKKEPLRICRLIDSTTKEYREEVELAYAPHGDAVKEKDEEEQRKKDAAAAAFEANVQANLQKIRDITFVDTESIEAIDAALLIASDLEISDATFDNVYGSRLVEARQLKSEAIETLNEWVKAHKVRADLAAQKAELAKQAAEQAAQQAKIDAENEKVKAAQDKVDADKKEVKKQVRFVTKTSGEIKAKAELIAAEIEAHEENDALELAKQAEADRVAAQAPDKEKLIAYSLSLRSVQLPSVADKKCAAYLGKIQVKLDEILLACEDL